MSRHRKILVIAPVVPAPWFGAGTRNFQLIRHLAAVNEVSVLTYASSDEAPAVERLKGIVNHVRVVGRTETARSARRLDQFASLLAPTPFHIRELHSRDMQEAINSEVGNGRFDIVQVEGSQLCSFEIPCGVAVVLDEHNVEYEVLHRMAEGERTPLRRAFSAVEYRKFRRVEQQWWRRADGVAVTSERELPTVERHAPGTKVVVVPNAVDPDEFKAHGGDPDPGSVLFFGTLGYRPNIDAVEWLLDNVLPELLLLHPGATVTVVGHGEEHDLDRFRRPGVLVTGRVPDVRPYLQRAAVTATPVRIGGGTRLKVLEALAMGKAVVSTTLGCEGLDVAHGEHVLVADDATGFAAAIARLLADPSEGARLGTAGRRLVVQKYSWNIATRSLEALYDMIGNPRQ